MNERIKSISSIQLMNENRTKELIEILPMLSKEQLIRLAKALKDEVNIRKSESLMNKLEKLKETK